MKQNSNSKDDNKDVVKQDERTANASSKHRNSSRKGNGRRRGGNTNSKKDRPTSVGKACGDDINDSTYYYSDPELLTQITDYSFNQFAGIPFDFSFKSDDLTSLATSIPTIMNLFLNPSAGSALIEGSDAITNGVTRAGLKNYYILSANNAKTTNYQPQDVTLLILALTSVFEMVSYMQRLLGTPYIFNVRNRSLPKQLITSQGVDYDDLCANMADYRIKFNILLQQINKIPIPKNVKAFQKSNAIYANYYVDDTSPMAQMYVLQPFSVWEFDELNAKLKTVSLTQSAAYKFSQYLDILNRMVTSLLTSNTFNFIFSDILRIADKEGVELQTFGLIPDQYLAPILYSDEFNLWVDNAVVFGSPATTATTISTPDNDVLQDIDNNTLKYAPAHGQMAITHKEYIVNFNHNNPNVEEKVAATRLISAAYNAQVGDAKYSKLICGSHYIVLLRLNWAKDRNGLDRSIVQVDRPYVSSDSSAAVFFSFLSKFKHAPRFIRETTVDGVATALINGDLDWYTTLSAEFLARMFDAEWITYLSLVSK